MTVVIVCNPNFTYYEENNYSFERCFLKTVEFKKITPMASEPSMDQAFINKLTNILEANLENELFGVKELAKAMGVSRSQLHRKVHAIYNKSSSQFIREFRLKNAMVMLQKNVATASEIAYLVGFASPTYFNTCFREYYGYTPGEVKYRNPLKLEEEKKAPILNEANPDEHSPSKLETEPIFFNKKWVVAISLVLVLVLTITYSFYTRTSDVTVSESVPLLENETTEKSIAVLPIKNWSGDPELEYIGDGMTDAVIARLALIESMTNVIPFTSILKYKTSDKNVPDIAKELDVEHILQGSFQLSGDQMKIGLYLIEGRSNKHIWSYEYKGRWDGNAIFKVQAEIAENVANNMNVEIKDKELEAIQKIPTQNKEAYNLLLQANFQASKSTKSGWENALPLFEKAIELDSTFVNAYNNLAHLYLYGGLHWGILSEQEAWDKAKELLQMSYQLDSTKQSVKKGLLFGSYTYEWDFDLMEKEYRKEYVKYGVAFIYAIQTGRYEESLMLINQTLNINPTSGFVHAWKARTLFYLNRKEEAINLLNRNDILHNDHIDYLREAGKCYFYMGEYKKSKELVKRLATIFPDRTPPILWLLAVHAQREGDMNTLSNYLEALQRKYTAGESGSPAWFLALYYAATGDNENAFTWLQNSFDRHEVEMIWLREEPALIPLRNDKRYLDIYTKVGFPVKPHSTPE